jgi:hypothetical protein
MRSSSSSPPPDQAHPHAVPLRRGRRPNASTPFDHAWRALIITPVESWIVEPLVIADTVLRIGLLPRAATCVRCGS